MMKKRNRKSGSRKSNLRKISLRLARPIHALLLAAAMIFPSAAANADNLYWTGGFSNTWDTTTLNWADGSPTGTETAFANGDAAYFDSISDDVTIAGTGITVSSMFVTDGSQFAIYGDILTLPAGKLSVTDSALALYGENEFAGGILLTDSTLTLGDALALGEFLENTTVPADSGGQVTVDGNGVIRITEDLAISNRFVIQSISSTLKFDLAADTTLIIDGVSVSGGGGVIYNQYAGQRITVSGTAANPKGNLVFSNNRAEKGYGGAIFNISTALDTDSEVNLVGLQSLTFVSNYAYERGGAIYSDTSRGNSFITLGNYVSFQKNHARREGGALSSAVVFTGISRITLGNHATFSDNTSGGFGGAIHSTATEGSSEVIIGSHATFTGNTATLNGGAIISGSSNGVASVEVGKNALFQTNVADTWGGAMYVTSKGSQVVLSNFTAFRKNRAKANDTTGGGGAVYSTHNLTVRGDTLFDYNLSGAAGGAIYMAGYAESTLLLDTNLYNDSDVSIGSGQIVFCGNLSHYNFTTSSGGTANAIHLDKNTTLKITGNGNVYFNDPISTGTGGGNRYEQTGGMVQFKEDSFLNADNTPGGEVSITGGTFRVVTGASFTTAGNDGKKFNVGTATLAGGGTITSPNGFYFNGATIAPDADTLKVPNYNSSTISFSGPLPKINSDNKIGALTLDGNVVLNNTTLAVDLGSNNSGDIIYVVGNVTFGNDENTVNITTWVLGEYVIIEAGNIASIDGKFNDVLAGNSPLGSNLSATLALSGNGKQLLLYTANVEGNNILTWTGADSENGDLWDIAASNWKSGGLTPLYNAGDYVVFNSTDLTSHREITVQAIDGFDYGVQVAGMEVSGDGDYTFSGGGIHVTKQGSTLGTTATGKLVKSGTGVLTLNNANKFANGVTLSGGAIVLGNNAALGVYEAGDTPSDSAGQVTVIDSATVGINDNLTISNRFVVEAGKTLTIDTDGNALTVQNVAGGAFDIAGGATLNLGDNLTLSNAAINAAAGSTVSLGTNTRLQATTGSVIVSAGTVNVYGESSFSTSAGNVLTITGGILNLDADAGHIAFNLGNLSLSNSTVNVTGDNTVYFDSALAGTSGSNYAQTGGVAQFAGTNVINTDDSTGGEVSVSGGVFRVVEGASFATAGTDGKQFNVTGGATLAGGGTIISANGFSFNGATISADSDRLLTPTFNIATNTFDTAAAANPLNNTGTLTLAGNVTLAGTTLAVDLGETGSDKIIVQGGDVTFGDDQNLVDILTWTVGEHIIMETTTGGFTDVITDINDKFADILANGFQLGANQEASLELRDGTKLVLVTKNLGNSVVLTWTGSDSATWDTTGENWQTGTNPAATFSIGDYVVFDSVSDIATNRDITIAGTFAQVAGMKVTGNGSYIFSGNIQATTDGTDYDGEGLGKLVKSGEGTLTLNGENAFIYGVTLSGGEIMLGDNKALGTYLADTVTPGNSAGQVTVTADAMVGISVDRVISNRFDVVSGAALTVSTGTDAILTVQNIDNGAGIGGAFALGVGSTLNLGDRVILTGNTASSGSAIYGDDDSVINFGTNTRVHSNIGDAVVSTSNVYVYGNTQFDANTGYAVNISGGTLAIDTAAGHVAFTGNTLGSVYLSNATLEISGGGNVYFDDAISGTAGSITQVGGLVQLQGDSAFSDADVEISGDGTLRVVSGASLDLASGTFDATSATLAGGGSISATSFSFDGATIAPDADTFATPDFDADTLAFDTAVTTVAEANKLGELTLNGDASFNNTTLAIDLSGTASDLIVVSGDVTFGLDANRVAFTGATQLGTWKILTSGNDMTGINFEDITGSFGGYSLTRGSSVHLDSDDATILRLTLDNTKNITLTWTGDKTNVWSTADTDRNWTDGGEETRFLTGDTVVFDVTGGGGTVYVDDNGVEAAKMTVAGNAAYIFTGGGITTSGMLVKNDAGTLTLNNANSFAGGTQLNGGRINLGNAAALGTQSVSMGQDTTLGFAGDYTITNDLVLGGTGITLDTGANNAGIGGIISGTAGFTKIGTDALTLSGVNTYSGGTVLSGGRINVAGSAALGSGGLSMAGGTTLGFAGGYTIANAISLTGNATIDTGTYSGGIGGVISGSGGFTKTGTGSLAMTGDNTFTGGTDVDEGEIRVGHANALGAGKVTMTADTTLAFGGGYTIGNNVTLGGTGISINTGTYNVTLAGNLSGMGGFAKNGTGTLTLSNASAHSGVTDINAGTLVLSTADGLNVSSAVTVNNAAILSAADDQSFKKLNVGGSATLAMNDHDLTIESGKIEGALTGVSDLGKTTADELEIATTASITGDLTLGAGTLKLSGANKLTVGKLTTIGAGTTLGLDTLQDGGMLFTGSMNIVSGATLDIKSFSGTETKVLVTSNNAITGFFDTIKVGGVVYAQGQQTDIDLDHFISGIAVQLGEDDLTIEISSGGYVWNNTDTNSAHGVFLVGDSGYVLDEDLANNTHEDAWFDGGVGYGKWDGKTLNKRGTGKLVLTGDNTFGGATIVEAGSLAITHTGALGGTSGVNLADDTVFELAYDANGSFGKTVTGTGGLLKTGTATVTFTAAQTLTGVTNIDGGTLALDVADTLATSSAVNVNDGTTLSAAKSQTFQQLNVDIDAAVVMTGTGADADLNLESGSIKGGLTGVNTITKTTDGELEIDTTANITGDLNLEEGRLTLGGNNTLTVDGTTAIGDDTMLSLDSVLPGGTLHSGAMTIGDNATLDVRTYAGSGTITLITSGSEIDGNFTKITVAGTDYTFDDVTISLDRFINEMIVQKTTDLMAIEISTGGLVWNNTGIKNAHGVFKVASGSFTLDENLADNLTTAAYYTAGDYTWDGKKLDKTGAGRLVLNGTNTFTGPANVHEGTLAITKEAALGGTSGVNLAGDTAFELAYTDDGQFGKVVSGTGGLLKTGTATVSLTAAQTFTGGTEVKAGTLALAGGGDISASSGLNLLADSAFDISSITAGQTRLQNLTGSGGVALGDKTLELAGGDYSGVIGGAGGILKTGDETLILRNVNTYTGTTSITGGMLQLAVADAIAASTKVLLTGGGIFADADQTLQHLETSTGTAINMGGNALTVYSGTLKGTLQNVSAFTKNTAGELNLNSANYLQNVATVTLKDGATNATAAQTFQQLVLESGATLDMNSNALTVASGTLSGALSKLGTFTKNGTGTLTLGDVDMLAGAGQVYLSGGTIATADDQTLKSLTLQSGTIFDLGGKELTVAANGSLTGSGTIIGDVSLQAHAIVSTGNLNTANTLTVEGDLKFAANSTYQVEVNPFNNASDKIYVEGTAYLNNAKVSHVGFNGDSSDYPAEHRWTILTADDGVNGRFDNEVYMTFTFLEAELFYTTNSVQLELRRNSINFDDFANTPNQHAVADGLNSLDSSSQLYNQVLQVGNHQDISDLYDQLSGEIHASLAGAMLDADRAFGRTLRQRIWLSNLVQPGYPLWFTADGYGSQADGDSNTAKAKHSGYGFNIGGEKINEYWMAGVVFRYADSDLKVNRRGSSSDINSYTLGVYGAGQIGFFQLSVGGTYGWHSVDSIRQISNGSFSQRLTGDYDAQTGQVFAELGFKCYGYGNLSVMPYFGFSWNSVRTDGFTERGGSAALAVAKTTNDNVNTTLGLRSSYLMFGRFALEGDLYWLHNYGDVDPTTDVAFTGGRDFTVLGSAFSRDAAGLTLSGNFIITQRFNVRASYNGLFSADASAHGGSVTAEVKF